MRIAISGASGFVGSALRRSLERDGHAVVRLVRREPGPGEAAWDPETRRIDAAALEGLDGVVHLAGEPIGRRWTPARKARIRESRTAGTRLIAETLARLAAPPPVLVSASAIGYYGDRGDERLDEDSGPGSDFLGRTGQAWEAATEPAAAAGVRVVHLRSGLVLGRGGVLAKLLPLFRLGLGGRIGSGRQWVSWISLADEVDAMRFALTTAGLRGPVNAAAPEPVTQAEFTRTLGSVLRRPTPFPVPAPLLRIVFGEMAEATLLASQRVVPDRLLGAGFIFRHPRLEEALRAAIQDRV